MHSWWKRAYAVASYLNNWTWLGYPSRGESWAANCTWSRRYPRRVLGAHGYGYCTCAFVHACRNGFWNLYSALTKCVFFIYFFVIMSPRSNVWLSSCSMNVIPLPNHAILFKVKPTSPPLSKLRRLVIMSPPKDLVTPSIHPFLSRKLKTCCKFLIKNSKIFSPFHQPKA